MYTCLSCQKSCGMVISCAVSLCCTLSVWTWSHLSCTESHDNRNSIVFNSGLSHLYSMSAMSICYFCAMLCDFVANRVQHKCIKNASACIFYAILVCYLLNYSSPFQGSSSITNRVQQCAAVK